MASMERPTGSREGANGGLRVLVRRSRQALRLLSDALRQVDDPLTAQTPTEPRQSVLRAQVSHAVDLTERLSTRFTLLEERFAGLSEKVEQLGVRLNDPPRRLDAEGTLRPPKVPHGLDVSGEPAGNATFGSRPFSAPADARQNSGFGVRSPAENVRSSRNGAGGPLLSGHITGLSLSSLFSLFEFERSSGSLTIQHAERRLDLLLRGGRVVRCELDGIRAAATASVREAFAWPHSTFTFRRDPEQDDVEPPQSVNALMLDAMRFHDEELRTG